MNSLAHNNSIDRLRGASILLVIIGHSFRFGAFWSDTLPRWMIDPFVQGAYFGVTIFFVISGYLIASKFLQPGRDEFTVDPWVFYVQRIGRIVPPLACLIVASLGYKLVHKAEFGAKAIWMSAYYLVSLDFNALKFEMPNITSSFDPLWSLSVEEAFYILLPILCLALRTKRNLLNLLFCVIGYGLFSRFAGANLYLYSTTFDQISIGVATAILAPALRRRLAERWWMYLRAAASLLLIAAYFSFDLQNPLAITGMALLAAAFIVASPAGTGRSAPPARWLERLGVLSYELYLTHMIVLWATQNQAMAWRGNDWLGLQNWAVFALRLALMYGVALLLQKAVSLPCNRLIRRWLIGDRRAATAGLPPAPRLDEPAMISHRAAPGE